MMKEGERQKEFSVEPTCAYCRLGRRKSLLQSVTRTIYRCLLLCVADDVDLSTSTSERIMIE